MELRSVSVAIFLKSLLSNFYNFWTATQKKETFNTSFNIIMLTSGIANPWFVYSSFLWTVILMPPDILKFKIPF